MSEQIHDNEASLERHQAPVGTISVDRLGDVAFQASATGSVEIVPVARVREAAESGQIGVQFPPTEYNVYVTEKKAKDADTQAGETAEAELPKTDVPVANVLEALRSGAKNSEKESK